MALEIVTGLQNKPHISSNDIGSFQRGVVGNEDYVMNVGKLAESQLVSNNKVRIYDGELVMQGVHFRILPGTYEDVTINNGAQNMKRKDLIVARYSKDASSGIENVVLDVLEGEPTSGTPVAPTPNTGDIRDGDLSHEMMLYVVELSGLNVVGVEPCFDVIMNMAELKEKVAELNSNLQEKIYDESVISIADFYDVNTFDLRKKGNEVFLTLSLSLNVPADELPFFPNSKYVISKSPIIEELIPRDVFHIGAFGCNNTWGETNPVSAWIDKDGYIRFSTPKINTFYKFYGHWFVD